MARPSKYKPEYCQKVIEHMREGASLTSFAASIGVARSSINEWMGEHPEFAEAVGVAKAVCATWWEGVARQNALTGAGNATMTIFGLKNMSPDDWRDRREIDHSSADGSMSAKPVQVELVPLDASQLSTEALREIMKARSGE